MSMREKIGKIISKWNPLAIRRRKNLRKELKNTTATFLCPNCIGGILFHDLGLQFRSPTVNLMMLQTDFAKFVLALDKYLDMDLIPYHSEEHSCPCGKLGDLTIHFTHYKSFQEGAEKWAQRAHRIDWDNLFIFLMERDGLTYEQIKSLASVKARGLVVFTAHPYPDIPYALYIPQYASDGQVGNILEKVGWKDGRAYETYFDFVKWFNEADGTSYDIKPYIK